MKKILVIDDDTAVGRVLCRMLASEYAVSYAPSVQAGLEVIPGGDFSLVFMDIDMPGRNGLEGLVDIRNIAPNLRIVLMTGSRTEADRNWILHCGADEFMPKPFSRASLQSVVDKQLYGDCAALPQD